MDTTANRIRKAARSAESTIGLALTLIEDTDVAEPDNRFHDAYVSLTEAAELIAHAIQTIPR